MRRAYYGMASLIISTNTAPYNALRAALCTMYDVVACRLHPLNKQTCRFGDGMTE